MLLALLLGVLLMQFKVMLPMYLCSRRRCPICLLPGDVDVALNAASASMEMKMPSKPHPTLPADAKAKMSNPSSPSNLILGAASASTEMKMSSKPHPTPPDPDACSSHCCIY